MRQNLPELHLTRWLRARSVPEAPRVILTVHVQNSEGIFHQSGSELASSWT